MRLIRLPDTLDALGKAMRSQARHLSLALASGSSLALGSRDPRLCLRALKLGMLSTTTSAKEFADFTSRWASFGSG